MSMKKFKRQHCFQFKMEKPAWIKQKTYDMNFEIIQGAFDEYRDFKLDPSGYFLIRINKETNEIEAAHCRNDHTITKLIMGKKAQELYTTIIKLGMVSLLDHAAYLGKEFKKAELCLQNNSEYEQE